MEKIKKNIPQYMQYLKTIEINGQDVFAIKKKEGLSECIFWDGDADGCKIYESRPMDCRLYPFDILLVKNEYCWIVYSCNKNADWTWSETYIQALELNVGFDDLMNNIDLFSEHTDMILPTELEKTPYEILRKVNWKKPLLK